MGCMLQRKESRQRQRDGASGNRQSQDGYNPKRTGCTKSDLWHCKDVTDALECLRPWNSSTWCILMRHLMELYTPE
jgi:hypothetical protein